MAHPSVRNIGTIGGNLMLKHAYPDFPSDLFLLVETIGAKLIIKSPGLVHVFTKQYLPSNLLVRFRLLVMSRNFYRQINFHGKSTWECP